MPKPSPEDLKIGKFDILATFTYVHALLAGDGDAEARRLGLLEAVKGANYRRKQEGIGGETAAKHDHSRESSVTADAFDHQVKDKLGPSFDDVFRPLLEEFARSGYSYAAVKRAVRVPTTWGAKLSGADFERNARVALNGRRRGR